MPYEPETIANLRLHHSLALTQLGTLQLQYVAQGEQFKPTRVHEFLVYGAGRRLSVLRHALKNVFDLFPPETTQVLADEAIVNAQINLHAFVINLSGLFDNLAWAFIFRHGLLTYFPHRTQVGLFDNRTTRFLPEVFESYIHSEDISNWHQLYLRNFRDALAHRIPLYIPRMILDPKYEGAYRALESQEATHLQNLDFDELEEIKRKQMELMKPYFAFLHSLDPGEKPRPVQLHPQVVADSNTVIAVCKLFLQHWDEVRMPTSKGTSKGVDDDAPNKN